MLNRLAAVLVAAALFTGFAPAAAHADDPTRILIVGDSITQGYRGDHTWRYFAYKAITGAGTAVDFVGPRTSTFDPAQGGNTVNWHYDGPDAYADPAFDQQHAAYWGQRLGASWMREPIGDLAAAAQPSIIVSNLGINDLSDGTAVALIDGYRQWVADARAVNPDVDLVIGEIPHAWVYAGRPAEFNALIDDLAAELTTAESRVEVFRVEGFTQADTWDGIHVNESGERKYARAVTAALGRLGVASAAVPDPVVPVVQEPVPGVPAEPQVTAPVATPPASAPPVARAARPAHVSARKVGAKVVVRWRASASAESYRVRCGQREVKTSRTTARIRSGATSCKVRAVNDAGASPWTKVRVRRG